MKARLTIVIASLIAASLGTTAFAQSVPQTPPAQQTPQQTMPPPQTPPAQPMPPQQMPPQQMPPATSAAMSGNGQANQSGGASGTMVAHEIKHALTQHGITATHVTVTFNNGTATLSGTVFSKQDVAKAKQVAMHVQGVTQVDDSGLHSRKG